MFDEYLGRGFVRQSRSFDEIVMELNNCLLQRFLEWLVLTQISS